jgi:hypothetical protein
MTTTSTAGRWPYRAATHARRTREPDDDVDTRVYVRPEPEALDRMMVVRIMRELEPQMRSLPAPRALKLPSAERNVFLTAAVSGDPPPPWAMRARAQTMSKRIRVIRRRSLLPWVAFAMMFAISFGVLSDPVMRHEMSSQLQSSAIRLYSFVSRILT